MAVRVAYWNPSVADQTFEHIAIERLIKAANIVKAVARRRCPVGTISRPVHGAPYTAKRPGQLRKSIRVVRKKTPAGRAFSKKRNVRIYAGTFLAHYAHWVEYGTSRTPAQLFLRPAFEESIPMIKTMIGAR